MWKVQLDFDGKYTLQLFVWYVLEFAIATLT